MGLFVSKLSLKSVRVSLRVRNYYDVRKPAGSCARWLERRAVGCYAVLTLRRARQYKGVSTRNTVPPRSTGAPLGYTTAPGLTRLHPLGS